MNTPSPKVPEPASAIVGVLTQRYGQAAFGVAVLLTVLHFAVFPLMDRYAATSSAQERIVSTLERTCATLERAVAQGERVAAKLETAADRLAAQLNPPRTPTAIGSARP